MLLNIIVKNTDDGWTADIPSLKGCETWAKSEDEVLEKIQDLSRYYLKLDKNVKFILDKSRKTSTHSIYKLVFDKA